MPLPPKSPGLALLALLLAAPVAAQETGAAAAPLTMEAVEQAWARNDFVTVRQGLKALAESEGSALAQYRYGVVLLEGRGGPVDLMAARDWLEKASAQSHLKAATLLARLYLSGAAGGPERDPARAATLLSNAAARGDAEAQYYLGLLYRAGTGVARDPVAAFNWLLAAAEAGHVAAQYELSAAYARGEGTGANGPEALRWLRAAAEAGLATAQYNYGHALLTGQGAPQAVAGGIDWLRRAAEAGVVPAQRELGLAYLDAEEVAADPAEAQRWLGAATQAGDVIATVKLAVALLEGDVLPRDTARGLALLERAADGGVMAARVLLGEVHETGTVVPADPDRAIALYRAAVGQGSREAALRLGRMAGAGLLEDRVAPHDAVPWALAAADDGDAGALSWLETRAEAGLRPARSALGRFYMEREGRETEGAELLRLAAEAGDVPAQYALGLALITGKGGKEDYVAAHSWLNVAAAQGHAEAADRRAVLEELMTREQVAEAQRAARAFFDSVSPGPADTGQ